MDEKLVHTGRISILHWNGQRRTFGAETAVDPNITANQNCDSKCAPDARSPPPCATTLNPVECGRQRKRMNDPRPTLMRMQNHSMNFRKRAKLIFHFRDGYSNAACQIIVRRTRACLDKSTNYFVVHHI